MCGRYLVDDEVYAEVWEMLSAPTGEVGLTLRPQPPALAVKGEVYPTNIAPIIACDGPAAIKWGFPHWKGAGVIINARAETAGEKSMFRKPLLERRCVVPSCGFYEWSHGGGGKKKDKYLLRLPGERLLFMAGMINSFRDASGCDYSAFVILTTAANGSVAQLHDRMPVILAPDERDRWICDGGFVDHALRRPGPQLELSSTRDDAL